MPNLNHLNYGSVRAKVVQIQALWDFECTQFQLLGLQFKLVQQFTSVPSDDNEIAFILGVKLSVFDQLHSVSTYKQDRNTLNTGKTVYSDNNMKMTNYAKRYNWMTYCYGIGKSGI